MAESSIDQLLETAKEHHKAGRRAEAEPLYRRYLAMKPGSAEAAHLLGYMTFEMGKGEAGLELIRRAIALEPDNAQYLCNLGAVQAHLMRHEEALESLRKALAIRPDFPEAWFNVGTSQFARQKIPESMEAFRKAIACRPNYPDAYNNLANLLVIEGRLEEAIAAYQQALIGRPDFAVAASNLGNTLRKVGRLEEAISWLRKSVAVEPEYRDGCKNLAFFLRERGQWTEAVAMYRRALYLHNGDTELEALLADSLRGAGELDEAIATYQRNLARRPGTAQVYRSLGKAYEERGDLKEAGEYYKRASKIQRDFVEVLCDLGDIKLTLGQVEEALDCFGQAINARPTDAMPYSYRLNALHYLPHFDPALIFHEHADWNQKHSQPLNYEVRPHDVDRNPKRRLRIGFVSAEFREHPIGIFMEGLLPGFDPGLVELVAYADLFKTDATTARIQKLFHRWRNTTGMSDSSLAEMIRNDKVDVLVDLAGHTPGNRLMVFARKPAPIQITYLGYPDTTGISAMDYRLTDIHTDPLGMTEQYYSEKLLRLPRSFICYRAPTDAPPVSPLPAAKNGYVTYGSLNGMAKINHQVTDLWVRILEGDPATRLLIINRGLSDEQTRNEFLQRFTTTGIDVARIDLRGGPRHVVDRLKAYADVDIALDTFPFNGMLSSCEALWMGVPLVTLAGATHASRIGFSILTNIKLPELIADSEEKYVQLALELAEDLESLAEIRESTREWLEKSPVMDGRRWAWNVESQIRKAWKEWVAAPAIPVEA
jgi:protein O-GlcNAc transferase